MYAIFYYPIVLTAFLIVLDVILYVATLFTASKAVNFGARLIAAYLSMILCATYGVVASIFLRVAGDVRLAQWTTARAFKWVMWLTTGIIFEVVEGQEYLDNTRPAVFIANHQSELDVLMLGATFPKYCSVTSKKSLKYWPFLGWFMSLSGTVFLDRAKRDQAVKAFEAAANEMKEHRQSVFVFAEGTRSYSKEPTILPFKKGAFHLALQAGVPIVPLVVENYSKVLYLKNLTFKSGTIRVKVLPPIPTKGLTTADINTLIRDIRENMLKVLEDMGKDNESKSQTGSVGDKAAKATGVEVRPEL